MIFWVGSWIELRKPATVDWEMVVSKLVSSGRTMICAVLEGPFKMTAAFLVPSTGRWNQSESPIGFAPCHADLHFWFPESRTSKTSNSPQPDAQQEQFPYWMVRGICALSIQAAGMSPLNPVFPDKGISNSSRNSLDAPSNPSRSSSAT